MVRAARTSAVLLGWAAGGQLALAQASQFALRFYGTGTDQQDRVRIQIDDNMPGLDASAPCDVGAGSFTIEFWLRGSLSDNPTNNAGGEVETASFNWIDGNIVVDRDIFGGSQRDWGISIAGGFVRFGTGRADVNPLDSENTIEGSVNVLDNTWHHVAVVRDAVSGIKRIYVDGLLDFASAPNASRDDISYPNDGVPDQATPWGPYIVLAAEKHDAGPAYPSFAGYLDEVRIWSVARSQADILATFDRVVPANAPGLVAYYRLESGSGTVVTDSSDAGSPSGELIAGVSGNGEWVSYADGAINTAPLTSGPLPPGFTRTTIATGLDEPTVIEFLPDGRLLIGERGGRIWIVQDDTLLPQPLIQIDVNTTNGERGLVGLARDPSFASNGFLYAYYTTDEPRNRVGRFTVVGNTADPASETLVWQNPALAANYHHGGAIQFGSDGNLYIVTGDQFNSANAQNLGVQHGKLLRVMPNGSIPPDNPFVGVPGAQAPIWAFGLRNPFRLSVDSLTGQIWIGDVGGNNSNSWEEVNLGVAGANYGWPNQEGGVCYVSDCAEIATPAFTYQQNDPEYYTTAFQASITLGPVYRGNVFPAVYHGNLFVGDYANRWIRRLVFDETGNVVGDPLFVSPPEAGTIVDLDVGPDGALYYVTIGIPWSGSPDAPAVHRIEYTGLGNAAPVVMATADPIQGLPPLTVQFSSAGTVDPDDGPAALTYAWTFGDGGTSNLANPSHVYTQAGPYSAQLSVSDGEATVVSSPLTILVGTPPTATITEPPEGTTYIAGDVIEFAGSGTDPVTGALPASALSWEVLLVHSDHVHPFAGPYDGVATGSFVIPTTGHTPENTHYEIQLTVTDDEGLPGTATRIILPVVSPLVFDTDPSGIPIFLDGEARATPASVASLVGFEHAVEAQSTFVLDGVPYGFTCWSDGGAATHTYVAPPGGGSLTATYAVAAGTTMVELTVVANNRNADYSPQVGERFNNFFDAFGLCIGRDEGGVYQSGFQFELPVPQGSVILSAALELTATNDQSGKPDFTIRAYDEPTAPLFVNTHTHTLTAHAALTDAAVSWSPPDFDNGDAFATPDLSALMQEVVNRPDWTPGNRIGIVLDGFESLPGTWRCVRNFASGDPARLTVSYAVALLPAPPFDIDCDLDVDLAEVAAFAGCLSGPEASPPASTCASFDSDADQDVDLRDVHALQNAFTG